MTKMHQIWMNKQLDDCDNKVIDDTELSKRLNRYYSIERIQFL